MIKPKLLLVSGLAPWPTTSGGAVRVLQTLKQLSKSYEIHFVYALDSDQDASVVEAQVKNFCSSSTSFTKQTHKSHFSFFSRGIPYWLSEWYNPELALIVRALLKKHQIEVVQIETSQLLYLVPTLPKDVFTVCVAYDVQLITFWRRLAETKNWLVKLGKLALLFQIWWYEQTWLKQYNRVVAVSEVDKQFFSQLYGLNDTLVVANGYEQNSSKKKAHAKFAVGFIGSTAHAPNKTAVEYLLQEIVPALQQENLDFEVVLAGETGEVDQALVKQPNLVIRQLGFLENVADFYQTIDVLVAPLFSGSGTRIKILESLSYQVPVVTTEIGAEGLEINQTAGGVLLANSPKTFVTQIKKIQQNPEQFKKQTITISQTWQAIFASYATQLAQDTKKHQTPA